MQFDMELGRRICHLWSFYLGAVEGGPPLVPRLQHLDYRTARYAPSERPMAAFYRRMPGIEFLRYRREGAVRAAEAFLGESWVASADSTSVQRR